MQRLAYNSKLRLFPRDLTRLRQVVASKPPASTFIQEPNALSDSKDDVAKSGTGTKVHSRTGDLTGCNAEGSIHSTD